MYQYFYDLTGSVIISTLITAVFPLVNVLLVALIGVYLERKVSAWMQDRVGPNRTGPFGLFQTIADFLKMLQKEDATATDIDKKLYNIAPVLVFAGSFAVYAVIPFSSKLIGSEIEVGLFYALAVSSFVVAGILMAGWSSNNKYSLLGAMRSAAQIVSYEIPTALVVLAMVMFLGTLSLSKISEMQTAYFWNWNILGGAEFGLSKFLLIPFMLVGFIIIFISTLAEVNRTPFDIPEAESELVAGYFTEYCGMKWAMFMLSEYGNMFAVSAIVSILFFGGYQSPFGYLGNTLGINWLIPYEQAFWFILKGWFFIFVQMWLRWTLPRLRVDQLMTVCWKYLIPYAFVNLIIIGIITLL
ncbi:MAG: NADH-quinone oxidoreductase subunit NuoH [Stygiobacter sp.]|jgi:NADH-quinone oxidoreductase subunit H|uniref:NADH-quinone oxidoreductase subunit H n=1 Tax=Stygiobacter electus TaxID=3032292 RepID=A0AAE3P4M2_9BACT|nr:NADH-quinone oxidoreductase subunit NuoH [Stygiobacter electus]MDF1613208.1 NADH-quinone oxidoreductase subunit NuoH [Stygiobacter electus]